MERSAGLSRGAILVLLTIAVVSSTHVQMYPCSPWASQGQLTKLQMGAVLPSATQFAVSGWGRATDSRLDFFDVNHSQFYAYFRDNTFNTTAGIISDCPDIAVGDIYFVYMTYDGTTLSFGMTDYSTNTFYEVSKAGTYALTSLNAFIPEGQMEVVDWSLYYNELVTVDDLQTAATTHISNDDLGTLECNPTCHGSCSNCTRAGWGGCGNCLLSTALSPAAGQCNCPSTTQGISLSSSVCVNCNATCLTCGDDSGTMCFSCKSPRLMSDILVVSCKCPSGSIENAITGNCDLIDGYLWSGASAIRCDPTCSKCSASGSTACIDCSPNSLMANGTCTCNFGFFRNNGVNPFTCDACDVSCLNCAAQGPNGCTVCKPFATLPVSPGICTCIDGYEMNAVTGNCDACDMSCKTCSAAGPSGCTSCKSPRVLLNPSVSSCVCPSATTENTSTGNCDIADGYFVSGALLLKCDPTCGKCSATGSSACTDCTSNASYSTGVCTCNNGYFRNTGMNPYPCDACDISCSTCSAAGPFGCSGCKAFATLPVSPGACICNDGFFMNAVTGNCDVCDVACTTCNAAGTAGCSCKSPKIWLDDPTFECVCPSGSVANAADGCDVISGYYVSGTTFRKCDPTCAKCSTAGSSFCTACSANTSPATGACPCSSGYFRNTSTHPNSCDVCHVTCATCNTADLYGCITCKSSASHLTTPGACICNDGYLMNAATGVCSACYTNCATCAAAGSSGCITCKSPRILSTYATPTSCICPIGSIENATTGNCDVADGYFLSSSTFRKCDPTCAKCSAAGSSACATCTATANIVTGVCTCKTGYFRNTSTNPYSCDACHVSCTSCVTAGLYGCTACKSNATYATNPGICTCNDGYVMNAVTGVCDACYAACATCSALGPTGCISCKSPRVFSKNAGLPACVCPSGSIENTSTGACDPIDGYFTITSTIRKCDPTCAKCSAGGPAGCTACNPNFTLTTSGTPPSGPCTCSAGNFKNTSSNPYSCTACHISCATCSTAGPYGCLTCKANASAAFSPGMCVCLNGYLQNATTGICDACYTTCATCSVAGSSGCTSCKSYRILATDASPSSCVCPLNTVENTSTGICDIVDGFFLSGTTLQKCNPTCTKCTASSACTACYTNANLLTGVCTCKAGLFWNTNMNPYFCDLCHVSCATCGAAGPSGCFSCKTNAVLVTSPGVCKCNDGYLMNATTGSCDACHASCATCNAANASGCITCKSPKIWATAPTLACVCPPASIINASGGCDSIDGYYLSGTLFMKCYPSCVKCSAAASTSCTGCTANATLASGVCTCSSGYFRDTATNPYSCDACHVSCSTCSAAGPYSCLACKSNATYAITLGICACNDGYVMNAVTGVCEACDTACATCNALGPTGCMSCKSPRIFSTATSSNTCICPPGSTDNGSTTACTVIDGYFLSGTTYLKCYPSCAKCSAAGSSTCTSCIANATLLSGSCNCNSGYFMNKNSYTCDPCHVFCSTCSSADSYGCLTCKTSATSATSPGICICNDGYVMNAVTGVCGACDAACATCNALGPTGCMSCKSPRIFSTAISSNTCICPSGSTDNGSATACTVVDGYFLSGTTYLKCYPSCAKCSAAGSSTCTNCTANATLLSGACTCNSGFFKNTNTNPNSCDACHLSCTTCTGAGPSGCTGCKSNATRATTPGTCNCNSGYFLNPVTGNCDACTVGCASCTSAGLSGCSCKSPQVMDSISSACVCPLGSIDNATISGNCDAIDGYFVSGTTFRKCDPTCSKCSAAGSTACTGCTANATLATGVCTCNPGYFGNTGSSPNSCDACHVSCSTCSTAGPYGCTSCKAFATLAITTSPTSCVCSSGYVLNAVTGNCDFCHATCNTCNAPDSTGCTSCKSPRVLVHAPASACVCPSGTIESIIAGYCNILDGYFLSGTLVKKCDPSCITCSAAGSSSCTSFTSNVVPVNSVYACIKGFFPNLSSFPFTCTACHASCATCDIAGPYGCTNCKAFASLAITTTPTSCVCSSGYLLNAVTGNCDLCHAACSTCNAPSSTGCTSCKSPRVLVHAPVSACVCPTGSIDYGSTYNCTAVDSFFLSVTSVKKCDPSCLTCLAVGSASCTSCTSNAVLSNGVCACNPGFFNDTSTFPFSCSACHASCATCSIAGSYGCLSCKAFANLVITTSPTSCACNSGYFLNTATSNCDLCHATCSTCNAPSSTGCTSCKSPRVMVRSPATSCACPTGSIENSITGNCDTIGGYFLTNSAVLQCDPNCLRCSATGSSACTNCTANAILANKICACNLGFFNNTNTFPFTCTACHVSCFECVASGSLGCTSCKANARTVTSIGACSCVDGFLMNAATGNCEACDTSCVTCKALGASGCTSCKSPRVLLNPFVSFCVCPFGSIENPITRNCDALDGFFVSGVQFLKCDPTCVKCSALGSTACTACSANASLSGGVCTCNLGFFNNTSTHPNTCDACHTSCVTCSTSGPTGCTMCKAFATQTNNPGVCSCSAGFFTNPITGNCDPCDPSCSVCTGPGVSGCTCKSPRVTFADSYPSSCLCPVGSTANTATNSCDVLDGYYLDGGAILACNPSCSKCSAAGFTKCTACTAYAAFNSGICTCNSGYYRNVSLNPSTCEPCHLACSTCSAAGPSGCTSCKPNFTIATIPGPCLCALGYIINTTTGNCDACDPSCTTCAAAGPAGCTGCRPTGYPVATLSSSPGACTCSSRYFNNGGVCTLCAANCQECTGASKSQCTKTSATAFTEVLKAMDSSLPYVSLSPQNLVCYRTTVPSSCVLNVLQSIDAGLSCDPSTWKTGVCDSFIETKWSWIVTSYAQLLPGIQIPSTDATKLKTIDAILKLWIIQFPYMTLSTDIKWQTFFVFLSGLRATTWPTVAGYSSTGVYFNGNATKPLPDSLKTFLSVSGKTDVDFLNNWNSVPAACFASTCSDTEASSCCGTAISCGSPCCAANPTKKAGVCLV